MHFFLRYVTRKRMLVSHFTGETARESPVAETDFPGEKHSFANNWPAITCAGKKDKYTCIARCCTLLYPTTRKSLSRRAAAGYYIGIFPKRIAVRIVEIKAVKKKCPTRA